MSELTRNLGGELAESYQTKVATVEAGLLKQPQVACPVTHRFGPGIYIREVQLPAGCLAIGHHQNLEHTNMMLKGRVTMFNEDGSTTEMVAPLFFVGLPGRKIGYVHEETVWQNIYPTTETDVEVLETTYLTKSDAWRASQPQSNLIKRLTDHQESALDYLRVLHEYGFTPEVVRSQVENEDDQVPMPFGSYKFKVGPSAIEGQGLLATADIEPEEVIGAARIAGKRTPLGRFANHSVQPNAKMVKNLDGDVSLVATKAIKGCQGGYNGEEITICYRQALSLSLQPLEGI